MLRKLALVTSLALLLALCPATRAGTLTIPLPSLLGNYTYESLSTGPNGLDRIADISTPFDAMGVHSATLTLRGTVTRGLIRGDGTHVPAQDVILKGGLRPCFWTEAHPILEMPADVQGSFERTWDFPGPYVSATPWPGPGGSPYFSPRIVLGFEPTPFTMDLPLRLDTPPSDPISYQNWSEGYTLITPLTGTITEAYLTFSGPAVPEPAALSLLALLPLLLRRVRPA